MAADIDTMTSRDQASFHDAVGQPVVPLVPGKVEMKVEEKVFQELPERHRMGVFERAKIEFSVKREGRIVQFNSLSVYQCINVPMYQCTSQSIICKLVNW